MKPLVVSVSMGYGHLRAAHPVAEALGVEVMHADRAPLADAGERRAWAAARAFHEVVSRLSQIPLVGRPFGIAMDALTHIAPLDGGRHLAAATLAVRWMERRARSGLGAGMIERLQETGAPLFTTFYAPAVVADRAGCAVFCLVTDADVNRIWVQAHPSRSRATYFAPTARAKTRLEAYGVRPSRVAVTGFPFARFLLEGAERAFEARLARLEGRGGRPPLVGFAVGGAGAQAGFARAFLPSLRPAIESGRLDLALVAGARPEVRDLFEGYLRASGLEGRVRVLFEPDVETYLQAFDALVAETDVLWTKPSEVTFYAALGVPLVLAPCVGAQEVANRAWALGHGAAIDQGDPARAGEWLVRSLDDGTLASAARAGFDRLPRHGLMRILEEIGESPDAGR